MPIKFISPEIDPYIGAAIVIAIFAFMIYFINRIKMAKSEGKREFSSPARRFSWGRRKLPVETQLSASSVQEGQQEIAATKEAGNIIQIIKNTEQAFKQFIDTEIEIDKDLMPEVNATNIRYVIEEEEKHFLREKEGLEKENSLMFYLLKNLDLLRAHIAAETKIEGTIIQETEDIKSLLGEQIGDIEQKLRLISGELLKTSGKEGGKEKVREYQKLERIEKALGSLYELAKFREREIIQSVRSLNNVKKLSGKLKQEFEIVKKKQEVESHIGGYLTAIDVFKNEINNPNMSQGRINEIIAEIRKFKRKLIDYKKNLIEYLKFVNHVFLVTVEELEESLKKLRKEIDISKADFKIIRKQLPKDPETKNIYDNLIRVDRNIKKNLSNKSKGLKNLVNVLGDQDGKLNHLITKLKNKEK